MIRLEPEDLALFLSEAEEVLENLEEGVVTLERQGESPAILAELFRAAHTLKGSSATAGFAHIASVTHHLESVLAMARDGECHLDAGSVDLLLDAVDWLRLAIAAIGQGNPGPASTTLVSSLESLVSLLGDPASNTPDTVASQEPVTAVASGPGGPGVDGVQATLGPVSSRNIVVEVSFSPGTDMLAVRMYQALVRLEASGRVSGSSPSAHDIEQNRISEPLRVHVETIMDGSSIESLVRAVPGVATVQLVEQPHAAGVTGGAAGSLPAETPTPPDPLNSPDATPDTAPEGSQRQQAPGKRSGQLGQSVRVNVSIIDSLMNLVGELIIDRTRLSDLLASLERPDDEGILDALHATTGHLGRTVSDVQESIMRARLMPLHTLFKRYPRMVRDLARRSAKEIVFEVSGEDTELDRSVIEALDDPLIHLLRNCVDHGIEPPSERLETGKPAHGRVSVSAKHQESCVIVAVVDDGRGISPSRMRSVAVRKGLLSEDEASRLSDEQAIDLIFMPGFTTATKVDETSGRGVGLDVVRANLKRINGSLDLWTETGKGTRFTMRLPLTLAVVRALLVSAARDVYAVPVSAVQEVVPLGPGAVRTVAGHEVIIVRDGTHPLVRLSRLLAGGAPGGEGPEAPCLYAVVVSATGSTVAFGVERILNEQEIVVRNLGDLLKSTPGISGATILGNGEIALILDAHALMLGLNRKVS
ncbi:MAG: chemotaxis protein CheA [Bacillota bacterium]|nr:chemotaxis protein CheA [Bacillota bacterium]